MLPSKIGNPNIKLLYLWGLEAQAKPQVEITSLMRLCMWGYKFPTHFMWTTIWFTEKLSIDCHHKGHIVY